MATLADSDAFRDDRRVLVQHQVAITLLQSKLTDPDAPHLAWLDLGCGRGQMLGALADAISDEERSRLHYYGYDADQRYGREATRVASSLGLGSTEFQVGDLADLAKLATEGASYDFVTMTNILHEVSPGDLAELLITALSALSDDASLFAYDMEHISPPELGAIPWDAAHIQTIVDELMTVIGEDSYRPRVSRFQHRSTGGWSLHLERRHLSMPRSTLLGSRDDAIQELSDVIERLLRDRLGTCIAALESLTRFGSETKEEHESAERLLHLHWSISRALGEQS